MMNRKKRSLVRVGFALLLGPALGFAEMGPLEPGTNRQGEDFRRYAFRVVSAEDCRIACDSIDACKAMTFVRNGNGGGDCWLKDRVPPTSAQPAMTSAMKRRGWKGEGGD
jgi:hypothetical protein